MITTSQKTAITAALNQYLETYKISSVEFSKRTEINNSYISSVINGSTVVGRSNISDKWYNIIADAIGLKFTKEYWELRPTDQLARIISTLEDAKEHGLTNLIIGESGSGKTHCSDLFVRKNPLDTFKVTVGSLDTIGDLLDKIIDVLKISTPKTKSKKIGEIAKHLKKLKLEGNKPLVIFDESEYMKQPALSSMKELYDSLKNVCGIVMIGTDQLLNNLEKLAKKNKPGMPQFYRRIKFGIRVLPTIDRSYKLFLGDIIDKSIISFLKQNCDNYGELHDVLVPAMREAERLDQPLTEDLIRTILGMPPL